MSARAIPHRSVEESGERRAEDRRVSDRRAPKRWLDPLFAATLVNQVAPQETIYARGYAACAHGPRAGIVVNVRA